MKVLLKACLASTLLGLASGVLASPTIELKDGSRIEGEIKSIENGVYTVLSPSLGTVHVSQSNIVRIVYSGDVSNAAGSSVSNAAGSSGKASTHDDGMTRDIQDLQTRLAQDPATMQSIMSLQSDPQIQAVLSDPAIVKAVQEGDFMSLLTNPKIQALESNEHLKQLIQQQVH
jgi:hypothetical protein